MNQGKVSLGVPVRLRLTVGLCQGFASLGAGNTARLRPLLIPNAITLNGLCFSCPPEPFSL